jgi:hypothetical protein
MTSRLLVVGGGIAGFGLLRAPSLRGMSLAMPIEGVRDARCASAHGVVVSTIHGDLLW